MKKILGFSDIHIGLKSYSVQESDGLYTAEIDARNALEQVLIRAKEDDIEMLICAGDLFHTNHPTSYNIKWLIDWLYRLDAIGKKSYFIPGNHDASIYSNSMAFMKTLNLKNIFLIDSIESSLNLHVTFGKYNIIFVPYEYNQTIRDRDDNTNNNLKNIFKNITSDTIIVGHIHESSAALGSERVLISKGVNLIDLEDDYNCDNILLTGHIHKQQMYCKKNVTVVYPGSLYYMESTDVGENKGYVLIDQVGNIDFEQIKNIRKFVAYEIPENIDAVSFLKNIRITKNSVLFLKLNTDTKIDEKELKLFLTSRELFLGKIIYNKMQREFKNLNIKDNSVSKNIIYSDYINERIKLIKDEKLYPNLNLELLKENLNNIGLSLLYED